MLESMWFNDCSSADNWFASQNSVWEKCTQTIKGHCSGPINEREARSQCSWNKETLWCWLPWCVDASLWYDLFSHIKLLTFMYSFLAAFATLIFLLVWFLIQSLSVWHCIDDCGLHNVAFYKIIIVLVWKEPYLVSMYFWDGTWRYDSFAITFQCIYFLDILPHAGNKKISMLWGEKTGNWKS